MADLGQPALPADPKTKLVLIVDDDDSVLNLLEILVRRDGFRIILAHSGEEALRLLSQGPDAMILDLMLPGETSGFEVLRHLRDLHAELPVIVVTAYGNTREVQEGMKDVKIALLLHKPINQGRLLEALHKVLKTRPPPPPSVASKQARSTDKP